MFIDITYTLSTKNGNGNQAAQPPPSYHTRTHTNPLVNSTQCVTFTIRNCSGIVRGQVSKRWKGLDFGLSS